MQTFRYKLVSLTLVYKHFKNLLVEVMKFCGVKAILLTSSLEGQQDIVGANINTQKSLNLGSTDYHFIRKG